MNALMNSPFTWLAVGAIIASGIGLAAAYVADWVLKAGTNGVG